MKELNISLDELKIDNNLTSILETLVISTNKMLTQKVHLAYIKKKQFL